MINNLESGNMGNNEEQLEFPQEALTAPEAPINLMQMFEEDQKEKPIPPELRMQSARQHPRAQGTIAEARSAKPKRP